MPNTLFRWIFAGIVLSVAGYLGYVLTQHVKSNPSASVATSPVFENADAGLQGFVYRQTEEGRIQWEVEAQNAQVYESDHHVVLERVHVRLLSENGQTMTLEADQGTLDTVNSNFDLRNREEWIAVEFANGYTILTPSIHWENDEREIRTNESVTIHGRGMTVTGRGIIAELHDETFRILDDVRVDVVS